RHGQHPAQVPQRHPEGHQGVLDQRGDFRDEELTEAAVTDSVATQPSASGPIPGTPMLDLLAGFIQELRQAGLPVSLTENLDAMEAVTHIPIEDREAFKYALGATLVKNQSHWRAFEIVFEVFFSMRGSEYSIADELAVLDELPEDAEFNRGEGDRAAGGGASDTLTPEQLAEMLFQSLLRGDSAMMRA